MSSESHAARQRGTNPNLPAHGAEKIRAAWRNNPRRARRGRPVRARIQRLASARPLPAVEGEAVMTIPALITSFVVAAAMVGTAAGIDHVVAQDMFADTRAVVEFQRAADSYAFLHRQMERRLGLAHRRAGKPIDVIESTELAAAIIAERSKASEGMLFTPGVVMMFRQVAGRASRVPGCDPGELRIGRLGNVPHRQFGGDRAPRPVNPCIADALPALPDELEYRSAGTVLLLVDGHANLWSMCYRPCSRAVRFVAKCRRHAPAA